MMFPEDQEQPQKTTGSTPTPAEQREARLKRIKQEIEAGTYDTDEKFNAALEKLLGQIAKEDDK